MKKLLATLALAPFAISACGGSKGTSQDLTTVMGVNAGGYDGMMTKLASGDIDFGGAWADSRFYAGSNASEIVTVGVEKNRIANDGIQARGNMNPYDMHVVQELFIKMIKDQANTDLQITADGKEKNLFSVYSHSAYSKQTSNDEEVVYLKDGVPTKVKKLATAPTSTGTGEIFNTIGSAGDYTDYSTKSGKTLKIQFIPSNDATLVSAASNKLKTFLGANGVTADITVSSNYDTAAAALKNGTIDLAFLPVNTWAQSAEGTNFILQAGRPTQVATLDWDGTNVKAAGAEITNQKHTVNVMNELSQLYLQDTTAAAITANASATTVNANITKFKSILDDANNPLNKWAMKVQALAETGEHTIAGSYEAFIWTKKDSALHKLIKPVYEADTYNADWTVKATDTTKYGYTSTTSGASYIFPELWIHNHLKATIKI